MKPFALLALALTAWPACACLNDRDSDSLATQAAQLPETLRVITGRFERNPPLYYQMRIERERAALKSNPRQFGLYDDIGVALDKLGRDDEALQTMARKRALLPAFNPNDKANKEAWYRYYANAGTFRAHRFLKAGAPVAQLAEMETARAQIKRAVEIKPDAHFGRERYQIVAMDWIIARKLGKTKDTLGMWIGRGDKWKEVDSSQTLASSGRKRAVEGLSGLIVLGGAWESPDVFEALGSALETKDGVTLRYAAFQRVRELQEEGKRSLSHPDMVYWNSADVAPSSLEYSGIGIRWKNEAPMEKLFIDLRGDADRWNRDRQDWMMAKLKEGAHPDTDGNFWKGYTEKAPPSLEIEWASSRTERAQFDRQIRQFNAGVLFFGAACCGAMWFFVRRRRLRAQI